MGSDVVRQQIANGPPRIRVGMLGAKGLTPRAHMPIKDATTDAVISEVSSGTFSPCLQRPNAMAYVKTDAALIDNVVNVQVTAKKQVPVTICKVPFVPKGYYVGGSV